MPRPKLLRVTRLEIRWILCLWCLLVHYLSGYIAQVTVMIRTIATVTAPPPVPENLANRAYQDIKDGAFAALLILGVAAVWFSHTWGRDVKAAIADFTTTMRAIADQTKANTLAVEELSDHVHKVDERIEQIEGHITQVEQVAARNKQVLKDILPSQDHSEPR